MSQPNANPNPLLTIAELPLFSQIKASDIEPAIKSLISQNRKYIETVLQSNSEYTFENLVFPLEIADDQLGQAWSVVSHLSQVKDSEEWRKAHDAVLPILTKHYTEMGQHKGLYKAFLKIKNSKEFETLDFAQKKVLEDSLRDFRLSGVALDEEKKARFKELNTRLSDLENKYDQNILDAEQGWTLSIEDSHKLKGLPEAAVSAAKKAAVEAGKPGWLITLDFPAYDAVLSYAEDQLLRKEVYTAYATLASDQGPNANRWDNSTNMVEILKIRKTLAELLEFKHYAEYALVTRMLKVTKEVMDFLEEMVVHLKRKAEEDFKELKSFVLETYGISTLEAWDIKYFTEKLREKRYAISEEELRSYFPENRVLQGLFLIANKLYGITVKEIKGFDTWNEKVKLFEVYDKNKNLRGKFYLDLFARPHKRKGGWCGDCKARLRRLDGKIQIPVAHIVTNFRAGRESEEALLSHEEVTTLFHEFGHCLHYILTQIDYPSISGLNGVSWDAVELPSQLMENWCWEKEALDLIAKHYKTGEALSDELFLKLKATQNFQIGMKMIRQLEFSLFDFKLHMQEVQNYSEIQKTLEDIRANISVVPVPHFNRFQNSFSHIFSGGYAAGYYSYLWSEVLSADVYELFRKNKLAFDSVIGEKYLSTILEKGGAKDMMTLFIELLGRAPKVDALLKQFGLK